MIKLFFAFLLGVVLMIPGFSSADQSKKEYSVKINNNLTAVKAVNLNGKEYIAVDDAASLWGFDYYINDTDGEVNLISKSGSPKNAESGSGSISFEK